MFQVFVGLQIVAIAIIIYTLAFMFRSGSTYAHRLMLTFLVCTLVQNGGYLLELFAQSEREALLAVKFEYLGSSLVAIFFMMFIRSYCGKEELILLERILLCLALCVIMLVWTNPWHYFYYRDVQFVETGYYPHLVFDYGWGFYFFVIVCAVIPWGISVLALISAIYKEKNSKRRRKLCYVAVGATFVTIVLIAYVLGVFPAGYDPTPLAIALMLFTLVVFVWNRKDYDLTRMAANTVLDSLGDCMITLDENKAVMLYNSQAKEMFPDIMIYHKIKTIDGFPMHIFDEEEHKQFEKNGRCYEGQVSLLMDFENVERGYTILIRDVTDIYEHIKEIESMRLKAEEANRAKSNFLANMSHEIRTPMNAVVGMSELLIEESRGRKMYDYACNIKSAALNLLSIINDILDLSKVEAGKMELVEDAYYIQVLIQDTVNLVQMAAEQKGLQMKVNLSEEIPHQLYGDEGRIRQVLINIINNSIKFTSSGSVSLAISSEAIDEEYINLNIVVEDTGIGIREEDLAYIFESFRQLDMSRNRKKEGTGLGLPITKELVTLMQGDIQVESTYGVGSRFRMQIKQKVVDKRTIREMPITRHALEEKSDRMFVCKDYKVLVVDDNIINRKVATAMLDSYALQIHEASSGEAAIELVKKNDYHIIFMDHMMPEMDGMEATRIIQTECGEVAKKSIIIALTANAIQGAKEMYLENGFSDFLSKPFERVQMHELLERWIPQEYRSYVDEVVVEDKISEDEMAEVFMLGVNVRHAVVGKDISIEEYLKMLWNFHKDAGVIKPRLCKLVYEEKFAEYGQEAKNLKMSAMKIGAEHLAQEAKQHEKAVKEKNYEFVDQQYAQLILHYERILEEIERVLKKMQYGIYAKTDK